MQGSHVQTEKQRIRAIDAARGTAMLTVFFSHFVEVFFKSYHLPLDLAFAITKIASPTFVIISGGMLGILFCMRGENYPATRSNYIRRGIFLLTVGRVLIFIAHIPLAGGLQEALRWGFMTDAIGFSIIIGPLLMGKLSLSRRLLLGVLTYGLSWMVILFWTPVGTGAMIFKETFFGTFDSTNRFYTDVFPILPWFGLYLAATCLGEFWGTQIVKDRMRRLMVSALRIGFAGVCFGVCLFAFRYFLENTSGVFLGNSVHMILSPKQKLPPGPVYMLFYGGCAFFLLYVWLRARYIRTIERVSNAAEVLGRNSLFVFIVQYFVFFSLFPMLDFPIPDLWPLYFAVSVALIWGLALLWDKRDLSRYLTMPQLKFLCL